MKQNAKWCTAAVSFGLILVGSAQAQYITGTPTLSNVSMNPASSFPFGATGANGISLISGPSGGYNWGEWDIPTSEQQVFNKADNEIIMTYTINFPAPGTTGADYASGNAWTWYSLQPLINTTGGTGNLERYGGYDGYNLAYGVPNGQGIANQDKGYVYTPGGGVNNGTVTLTVPLNATTKADIAAGDTISFFQISMDPTSTLPDGYVMTINSIQLAAVAPEPSTLALTGLGLGAAVLLVARRRRAGAN